MSPTAIALVCLALGLGLGAVFMWVYRQVVLERNRKGAMSEADRIVGRAKSEAGRIEREAKAKTKDLEVRIRKTTEADIQKQKQNLKRTEDDLKNREAQLENDFKRKQAQLERRQSEAETQNEKVRIAENRLKTLEEDIQKNLNDLKLKLENVSNMSTEEAKRELVRALEDDAKAEAAKKAIVIEQEAQAEAEKRAKRVISVALSRYAGEYTAERTVSIVGLPSEEMKGKIIGREGRNIRALEAACGVDLIVDETPEAVVISGFDPVRREVARRALEKLMEDGRVHPGRIEEVVDRVKKELFKSIKEDGEKACFELGLHGVHPELVKLIGSLKYRATLTQNNYQHSLEVGFLAGLMAEEIGVDPKLARRAGLLHDIGKALDHSLDGSHAQVGADFAKRHGETEVVVSAILTHEDKDQASSIVGFLVQAANVLSNSRPGARRNNMESFVRRLEDMESIGNSFDGVSRTFAVQAGRELRVMVESSKVTDEQAQMLSRDIVRKIERELSYPGQIRVTVVRETRAIEHAR
jgi:ribonuclease Y